MRGPGGSKGRTAARRLAVATSLTVALVLGACKREEKPPKKDSLAALEAEWPPHTPTCKAWTEADLGELEPLPEGPHVESFEYVWRTLAEKHYDPTLACLDWIALRKHYGEKVAEAGSDATAAYASINEMLGLLGQSHLHATAPISSTVPKREVGPATVPIVVRWLPVEAKGERKAVVVVDEAVDGHTSEIPRGAILTRVDGESVEDITKQTKARVNERGGRATEVAFMVAREVGGMLSCPRGGSKVIEFLDPAQSDAKVEADIACFMSDGERMSLGNLRDLPTVVKWRMLDEPEQQGGAAQIGYLAFNIWMLPMAPQIQAGVDALRERGMDGLIVDLRGNPGGVGSMSIPIARMLVREGASLGRLQMREFNQEFKVEANPDAFAGPIAILVDEGTASTSEIFALGMRDIGRVSIVGAGPSAGMALPSMIEELPDGGLIQYVVGDYHSAKGTAAEGEGVVPKLLVEESRADYVARRDPVLDAAVEHLRTKLAAD